jgi:hypothetical protein
MVNVKNDKFSSIILQGEKGDLRLNEGDAIVFTVETTGQRIEGSLTKIAGTKKERFLQILPLQSEHQELWSLFSIAENSLVVTKRVNEFAEDNNKEDEDDEE